MDSLPPNTTVTQPSNADKPDYDDVAAWGLSLRGMITFLLIATVCILAVLKINNLTIDEMATVCLMFYFNPKAK